MKSLQMQSCVHEEGTIECALFEVDIASPKDNEEDTRNTRYPTEGFI